MADLATVLNAQLDADSPCRFMTDRPGQDDSTAIMTLEDRAVAVHVTADGDYLCEFWRKDRNQARGTTADASSVVDASCLWVEGVGLSRLSAAHPFVEYFDLELAYERGEAVEYQWRVVLREVEDDFHGYGELVALAAEEPVLRRRFPRLGHRFVLFENADSKDPLFSIFMIRPEWYATYTPDGSAFDFEGTAREAVAMMTQAIRTRGADHGKLP
ncbi:DUF6193 family natural product biosynthesis protein [Actinoplanes sp. NPDC049681]|uniref:DUF6193 family natural product biosynthesis protein n=1 Tax=Actinoplanes sp. NPDC049681 TaxID=3363905 RepID=UPI0037B53645